MTSFFEKVTTHPANADVLAFLRARADPTILAGLETTPLHELAFGGGTHPDLGALLHDAADTLPEHYSRLLYGIEVIANPNGVVFALAWGMSVLGFRLPEELRPLAFKFGARPYEEVGKDWMQFDAWEKMRGLGDPEEVEDPTFGPWVTKLDKNEREAVAFVRYWCEHAYQYAKQLSTLLKNPRQAV